MSREKCHTSGRIEIPDPQTMVSTGRKHKVAALIMLNVSNSIGVTLIGAASLQEPRLILGSGVKVDHRNVRVFATNQEYVAQRVSLD